MLKSFYCRELFANIKLLKKTLGPLLTFSVFYLKYFSKNNRICVLILKSWLTTFKILFLYRSIFSMICMIQNISVTLTFDRGFLILASKLLWFQGHFSEAASRMESIVLDPSANQRKLLGDSGNSKSTVWIPLSLANFPWDRPPLGHRDIQGHGWLGRDGGLTLPLGGDLAALDVLLGAANPLLLVLLLAGVGVLLGGELLHLLLLLLVLLLVRVRILSLHFAALYITIYHLKWQPNRCRMNCTVELNTSRSLFLWFASSLDILLYIFISLWSLL